MENISNISSEEELLQLRNDGKISEAEYQELLESMNKPASDITKPPAVAEPQFEAFRIRLLTGSLVFLVCIFAGGYAAAWFVRRQWDD